MKRVAKYVAVIASLAIVVSTLTAKKAQGLVATAVQVVNTLLPVNTESAKTPFQKTLYPFSGFDSFQVPAGQRLVIESASGYCELLGAPSYFSLLPLVQAVLNGETSPVTLSPILQGSAPDSGGRDYFFTFNNPGKFYADPGSVVLYEVTTNSGTIGAAACPVTLTGYLINP